MKDRLAYIDLAKGFAIILIVFRHVVAKNAFLVGFDDYIRLKDITSKFDISLFFFLAGVTFGISFFHHKDVINFRSFVFKKIIRIIPAYFTLAVIIYCGSLILDCINLSSIDATVNHFPFYNYLLRPEKIYGQFLWFLYVLVLFYIFTSVFIHLKNYSDLILIIFSLFMFIISLFGVTDLLAANKFCKYFAVFAFGFFCYKYKSFFLHYLDTHRFLLIVLFVLLLPFFENMHWLIVSLVSIPAIICLSRLRIFKNEQILTRLGYYSFSIYIFHMFVTTSIIHIIIFIDLNIDYYFIYVGISILLSLIIPYCLKKKILVHSVTLDRYF